MKRIYTKKGLLISFFGFLVLVFALFTISKGEASASELERIDNTVEKTQIDLNKIEAQEIEYTDKNGRRVVIGAVPEEPEFETFSTKPIAKGTTNWNIYWYTGAVNMSYKIKINRTGNSAKITDAHSLSVTMVGYTESNRKFGFTSKKAEYSGTANLYKLPVSMSVRLTATISGTNLNIVGRA